MVWFRIQEKTKVAKIIGIEFFSPIFRYFLEEGLKCVTLGWLVLYERKRTPIPPLRFSVALSGIHLFGVIHAYITLGITGGGGYT